MHISLRLLGLHMQYTYIVSDLPQGICHVHLSDHQANTLYVTGSLAAMTTKMQTTHAQRNLC